MINGQMNFKLHIVNNSTKLIKEPKSNMEWISIIILAILLPFNLLSINKTGVDGQGSGNNCSKIFRGVRRAGANMAGRLEIPVDADYPKFRLRLKFNRQIHHLTVRQLTAKDVGGRREFVVDPLEVQENGIMRINALLRLASLFSPSPRLIGVSYNGKLICGENVIDDAILVELKTTTARPNRIISNTTTKQPKDQEDDDEVFN